MGKDYSRFLIFAVLGGLGFFGYRQYSINANHQYNEAYIQRIAADLANQSSLEDSLDLIKQEKTIMMIAPQNENLSEASKNQINQWFDQLKARQKVVAANQKDNDAWQDMQRTHTVAAYTNYLRRFPNGLHVAQASEAIVKLQQQGDDGSGSGDNSGRSTRSQTVVFKSIKCLVQNEITGKDRIKFTVNGETYLTDVLVGVGEEVSLSGLPSFTTSSSNPLRVSLIELDDRGAKSLFGDADDILIDTEVPSKSSTGMQHIEQAQSGAKYKIFYTLKNK